MPLDGGCSSVADRREKLPRSLPRRFSPPGLPAVGQNNLAVRPAPSSQQPEPEPEIIVFGTLP
jgi:hypothetical protein